MASILFKWLLMYSLSVHFLPVHPIFVSVTQIEHNAKEKSLEISCKIFTDDFEKVLRTIHKLKIDLLDNSLQNKMAPLVFAYINKHLQVKVNGKPVRLKWVGYEQNEEGIMSFLQVDDVSSVHNIEVKNDILYEYKSEQLSLIHVIVNGERQSVKLNNPEDKTVFKF